MGVFIIVKYMEKLKAKYTAFKQKRQAAYIILAMISMALIYVLFAEDTEKVKVLDEVPVSTTDTAKAGKVVYTVNNDFTELENPFSFAHEKENEQVNEPLPKQTENIAANKTVDLKEQPPLKQNTAPQKQAAENKKAAVKKYKVKAVFDINQHKSALVNVDGQDVRVEEGTEINGATVAAISPNSVILQTTEGMFINCPLNNF